MKSPLALIRIVSTAFAALSLSLSVATAGTITQSQSNFGAQIDAHEPIGQSFTAEDANILSIGFYIADWNQHSSGLLPITVTLFDGSGFGGTNLGSANIAGLTPGYSGWFYADFSTVSLTVGSVYTASLTALTARGGVDGFSGDGSAYAGGMAFLSGAAQANADLKFEVVAASSVPDQAATVPFLLALVGLFATRRSLRR